MTKEDKERYEIIKEDLIVLNRRLHQVKLKRKEQRHIKKIVDKQMEDLDKEIRDLILNIRYLIIWREYGNKRRCTKNRKNG